MGELDNRVAIVTGGARGIGRAIAEKFLDAGAALVVIADLDGAGAEECARSLDPSGRRTLGIATDVARKAQAEAMAESAFGPVDLFCANAGVSPAADPALPDAAWEQSWRVNTMAHVRAARALLPGWLERGSGYFLTTASAAGLLTMLGSAPYSVTKHAALAFAEWLSITYGDQGLRVSALCPQGVKTNMLYRAEFAGGAFLLDTAIEPSQVADAVVQGMAEEKFLILPHPEVAKYFQNKASDYERWLRGLRKLQATTQILSPKG